MERPTSNGTGATVLEIPLRREDLPGDPDHALMVNVREGAEDALETLLQKYWTPLVRYALGFVRRQEEAEDIVQESFIRLWTCRERWIPHGSVRGYLYTIVRNLSLHECDRSRVRDDWAAAEQATPHYGPTPVEIFEEREVLRVLERAIEALPERRREVFRLACLHGLSYREVADTMGIAVPTVANHMSAALTEIRLALRGVSDIHI